MTDDAPSLSATAGTRAKLKTAVHQHKAASGAGLSERLFTWLFSGLVYSQIWEDPEVDLRALELKPGARLVCIGSGGCNAFSYLTADPSHVEVVDLNKHHVQLMRLKQAGLRHLPDYQSFYRFFGAADRSTNPRLFDRHLAPHLPAEAQRYWNQRDHLLRRRISRFARNIYHYGLLGRFIAVGHLAAWLLGVRLAGVLETGSLQQQRDYFDKEIAPLFERPIVRWITARKASLFGLGIPPAQYDSLAQAGGGDMAVVLKRRLEKLACDFPVQENYFAHQAFARRYADGDEGPLPPYLQSRHFDDLRTRADRVEINQASLTDRLAAATPESFDAYVLLDAQDWMTDAQLDELWSEITRTARPGARVIFRTADEPSLLPGRLSDAILDRWTYREARSVELNMQDRSAIYGGFHIYELKG